MSLEDGFYPPKYRFERFCLLVNEWWNRSRTKFVWDETIHFPTRILSIRRKWWLRFGWMVPPYFGLNEEIGLRPSLTETIDYGHRIADDIESIVKKNSWMGVADQQVAAEAYKLGAIFGYEVRQKMLESGE